MRHVIATIISLLVVGAGLSAVPAPAGNGSPPLVAKMTLADGTLRTVALEGVGCSEALCSRVAVRSTRESDSRVTSTWLDALAAITEITPQSALFVMKNGTAQRLSVVHDNRFLYFADDNGVEGKIDLAGVKRLEFLPATR